MTRLHFFLHDTVSGENPSAVVIARPNITQPSSFGFGTLFAINDPLTVGPAPTSTLIGNAQGLYVSSSRDPAVFTTVMYADFAFTSGRFNGSSFSLISRSSSSDAIREFDFVGGRGAFRMAQGFALTQINFANMTTGDVILECNGKGLMLCGTTSLTVQVVTISCGRPSGWLVAFKCDTALTILWF
ncbi:hypothetical protein Golob_014444, partial [Gossypium lobatum]|nr:hypothetical protein [Gossypium lobatum]